MATFETACQATGIALQVLPSRRPKLNGRVERLDGTARQEFRECYDGNLDLLTLQAALRAWDEGHNTRSSPTRPWVRDVPIPPPFQEHLGCIERATADCLGLQALLE